MSLLYGSACSGDHEPRPEDHHDAGSDAATPDAGSDAGDGAEGSDAGQGGVGSAEALSEAEYLAACMRVSACEPEGAPLSVSRCLWLRTARPNRFITSHALRIELAALDCQLAAKDCESMKRCVPDLAKLASACGAEGGAYCAGNTLVECNEQGAVSAVDCTALGKVCGEGPNVGNAACGEEACDASTWKNRCEGNALLRCNSGAGVVDRIDCSIDQTDVLLINTAEGEVVSTLAGEVCGIDEGDFAGEYNCIGRGESCEAGEQGCDGSVLTACAGGHRTRRDCAAQLPEGMGCGFTPTGMASCGPTQTACELEAGETCEAGVIGYCGIAGPATLDCKALGYTGCKTTADDGRTVASCTR